MPERVGYHLCFVLAAGVLHKPREARLLLWPAADLLHEAAFALAPQQFLAFPYAPASSLLSSAFSLCLTLPSL